MRWFSRALAGASEGVAALLGLVCSSCVFPLTIIDDNAARTFTTPSPPAFHTRNPVRKDARLAVLWVGHATTLVQLEDRLVMTDPVFSRTVGILSPRLVAPGLEPADVPRLDAVLISHMHFDHLSLSSLDDIEGQVGQLLVPQRGLIYVPGFDFPTDELRTWHYWERGGLRITAVPVQHVGYRYGADDAWMSTSYTGYVIEYRGLTVYYGGDTGYNQAMFEETRKRFPHIDLALLPIAPIHPRDFMAPTHVDPEEAVRCFRDLGAKVLVPIHFDTFINSHDAPGEAPRRLRAIMRREGLTPQQVRILKHGEQVVLEKQANGEKH
ncbi:MAG: MBL fold metallo-hydrolase [Polyangiaceae bacterium]|nr:MBL fold metallo-hydrolase [Myxococcales bacterium]MCB9589416.1 MBL fold metallo-hydrolase [Polyangiaceae bacterium]